MVLVGAMVDLSDLPCSDSSDSDFGRIGAILVGTPHPELSASACHWEGGVKEKIDT
jgi:hypothetical protein